MSEITEPSLVLPSNVRLSFDCGRVNAQELADCLRFFADAVEYMGGQDKCYSTITRSMRALPESFSGENIGELTHVILTGGFQLDDGEDYIHIGAFESCALEKGELAMEVNDQLIKAIQGGRTMEKMMEYARKQMNDEDE